MGTYGQGFFTITKNKRGGGLPQSPLPPSLDQSDHRGKKRNLQKVKSGQAIFGTPSFGSKTPSPLPPCCSKDVLPMGPFGGPMGGLLGTYGDPWGPMGTYWNQPAAMWTFGDR